MNFRFLCAMGALFHAVTAVPTQAAGKEGIVASIKPVHSLVAAVMGDTGAPFLIIRGGASPHTFTLKPSVAKRISDAGIIFWVGPALETSLAKPIAALKGKARLVTLSRSPGLTRVRLREGGLFDSHAPDDHDSHPADHTDNHFWLDPVNAKIFVDRIEGALIDIDRKNENKYSANARVLRGRLDALTHEIHGKLQAVKGRPFIVFHDGYQYFERRFGIPATGSVVVGPGRQPGARRLSAIQRKIRTSEAICVFSEPQFTPNLVRIVTRGTAARGGQLDPIGAGLPEGPDLYFTVMRTMAQSFANCLGATVTGR